MTKTRSVDRMIVSNSGRALLRAIYFRLPPGTKRAEAIGTDQGTGNHDESARFERFAAEIFLGELRKAKQGRARQGQRRMLDTSEIGGVVEDSGARCAGDAGVGEEGLAIAER